MVTVSAISLIIGATASLRYRVFILIPLSFFAIVSVTIMEIAAGHIFVFAVAAAMLAACGLQAGYVLALFAGFILSSSAACERGHALEKRSWRWRL
jgi:hypothetical protein